MASEPIVQELWVISSSGLPLYNQCLKESCDPTLFGGLLAALQQFAHNIDREGCKAIRLGNSQLSFIQCPGLDVMIVCRSDDNVKEARIFKYLGQIKERFIQQFGEALKNWNGDLKVFADFEKVADLHKDAENWLGVKLDKEISRDIINQL